MRQILWSPHPGLDRVLVGSSDLRLYEWSPGSTAKLIAYNNDIPSMKCFDWSPNPQHPDLIAVGQTNGRCVITVLHPVTGSSRPQTNYVVAPLSEYNPRQPRACNAIAFSSQDPRYIACGLERVRNDHGLLIWDVETAAIPGTPIAPQPPNLQGMGGLVGSMGASGGVFSPLIQPIGASGGLGSAERGSTNGILNEGSTGADGKFFFSDRSIGTSGLPLSMDFEELYRNSIPGSTEHSLSRVQASLYHRPFRQYGSSDGVSSLAWVHQSSVLISGMGGKFIRFFDTKDKTSQPSLSIFTKTVCNICVDPFHPHRFAASQEDGIVKIWDSRKPNEPIDARNGLSFCPCRRGTLATLGKTATSVRIWSIQESGTVHPTQSSLSGFRSPSSTHLNNYSPGTQAIFNFQSPDQNALTNSTPKLEQVTSIPPIEEIEVEKATLWRSRRAKTSGTVLTSFVFVPFRPNQSKNNINIAALNSTSSIEHVVAFDSLLPTWSPQNNLIVLNGSYAVKPMISNPSFTEGLWLSSQQKLNLELASGSDKDSKRGFLLNSKDATSEDRGSSISLSNTQKGKIKNVDDPSNTLESESVVKTAGLIYQTDKGPSRLFHNNPSEMYSVKDDIAFVMKNRAILGYSMNAVSNKYIVQSCSELSELWNWIDLIDRMSKTVNEPISLFNGVYSILHSEGNEQRPNIATSTSVPSETIFGISFVGSHRELASKLCGWEQTSENMKYSIQRMEKQGLYSKACCYSLFHYDVSKAIEVLNASNDQQLKLVTSALAAHFAQRNGNSYFNYSSKLNSQETMWKEVCQGLSSELTDPYLRFIFGFIASNDLKSVLSKPDLPIKERVGIALNYMNDDDLEVFLNELIEKVVKEGRVDGLFICGLSEKGLQLFSNYVDKTSDIQTSSLVLSYLPQKFHTKKAKQWIESYRQLLDRWQLYHARAKFDVERGKKSKSPEVAPQVVVRCNFCNRSIANEWWLGGNNSRDPRRASYRSGISNTTITRQKVKGTCCPNCRKPLPRCALCLLPMGPSLQYSTDGGGTEDGQLQGFDVWFTWCQSCRHGGHQLHIKEWFLKHDVCPVSDCNCHCRSLSSMST